MSYRLVLLRSSRKTMLNGCSNSNPGLVEGAATIGGFGRPKTFDAGALYLNLNQGA